MHPWGLGTITAVKKKWGFSQLVLITATALYVGGCSSASKMLNDPLLSKMLSDVPFPKSTIERIAVYRKYSAKFLKFHDSGELSTADVQNVLRDAGVLGAGGSANGKPATAPTAVYTGSYRWPTDAGIISSEFGSRWGKKHEGIDVAAHEGEPVKAAAAGVVLYAGNGLRGYGNVLILRHDNQVTTLYGHNSKLIAQKGQKVAEGETVALLGSTGHSTGPHVHFEVRNGNQAVNPRSKLGKAPYH